MKANDNNQKLLIAELIERLSKIDGIKQKDLAESIDLTPTAMSLFLTGHSKTALSALQVEQVFKKLGIDLNPYVARLELAECIARQLADFDVMSVATWSRDEFVSRTGKTEILLLPDYDETEFVNAYNSGLIDMHGTFASFKGLVVRFMKIHSMVGENKITPVAADKATQKLVKESSSYVDANRKQVLEITKKDKDTGLGLGALLFGTGGVALALATCFLLATKDKLK